MGWWKSKPNFRTHNFVTEPNPGTYQEEFDLGPVQHHTIRSFFPKLLNFPILPFTPSNRPNLNPKQAKQNPKPEHTHSLSESIDGVTNGDPLPHALPPLPETLFPHQNHIHIPLPLAGASGRGSHPSPSQPRLRQPPLPPKMAHPWLLLPSLRPRARSHRILQPRLLRLPRPSGATRPLRRLHGLAQVDRSQKPLRDLGLRPRQDRQA